MTDPTETENNRYPWRTLYLLVLGFLLFQILVYYWLTIHWQ